MANNKTHGNAPQTTAANVPTTIGTIKREFGTEVDGKLTPSDLFAQTSGVIVFGADYERLVLQVGQVSPFLRYVRKETMKVENERPDPVSGVLVKVEEYLPLRIAQDIETGKLWSLPIAQIFRNHWTSAAPKKGELFAFKRMPDAIKQKGMGKGNAMENYVLAFPERIPEENTDA
jgi:hypothetical protein